MKIISFRSRDISSLHICFSILLFLFCNNISSQSPSIEHEQCFGGNDWDIPYELILTSDNNYLVLGASESTDGDVHGLVGDRDLWVLKITPDFDTLWTRSYGGTGREWADDVIETSDGGYLLCSETYSDDGDVHGHHGLSDAWLLKLNSDGDTLWTKCLGGTGEEGAQTILPIDDSGYLLCCYTSSVDGDVLGNHGEIDIWLLRLDANFDTLWTRCYGGSANDFARTAVQTAEGDFVVGGYSASNDGDVHGNQGGVDFFVMKIDPAGDTLWTRCYGGTGGEGIYDIVAVPGDGFFITGYTLSEDGDISDHRGNYDAWIVKLDDSGNMEWERCLGGTASDYTTEALLMDDGSYIVAGYAGSVDGDVHGSHGGDRDAWLVSLSPSGDTLWTRCYGGSETDEIQALVRIENGFLFAAYSNSEDGDVLSDRYLGHDFWMAKLTYPEEPISVPLLHQRGSVYPNPTKGKFFIGDEGIAEISVYDCHGCLVTISYDMETDMSGYSPGIYIIKLSDNRGNHSFRRLVLVR